MISTSDELRIGIRVEPDLSNFSDDLKKKVGSKPIASVPVKLKPTLTGVKSLVKDLVKSDPIFLPVYLKPSLINAQSSIRELAKSKPLFLPVSLTIDVAAFVKQRADIQDQITQSLGKFVVTPEMVLDDPEQFEEAVSKAAERASKKNKVELRMEVKNVDFTDPKNKRIDAQTVLPDNQAFYSSIAKRIENFKYDVNSLSLPDEQMSNLQKEAEAAYALLEDVRRGTAKASLSMQQEIEQSVIGMRRHLQQLRDVQRKSTDVDSAKYKKGVAELERFTKEYASATDGRSTSDMLSLVSDKLMSNLELADKIKSVADATQYSPKFISDLEKIGKTSASSAEKQIDLASRMDIDASEVAKVSDQLEEVKKASTSTFADDQSVIEYASKVRGLNQAAGTLEATIKRIQQETAQQKLTANISRAKDEFTALGSRWSALFSKDSLGSEYRDILSQFDLTKTQAQWDALNARVKSFKAEVAAAGMNTQSMSDKIHKSFTRILQAAGIGASLAQVVNVIRQMTTATMQLDAKVTDLQIASGKSKNEVKKLVREYANMGKELGATAIDVASAGDTFLRQGHSIANTNALIADSMMLSKLGQIEAAEASTALTSAMKGYKIEAEDARGIVDKLTAVDMEAAASAGGIATAMARTANSANIAGISMDRLIGYITTVKEVTQSADEEVGNFYKTLFARIGAIKAGNLYDPENAESLSDVETTLSGVGIHLRDAGDQFRNFGVVLDEVAANWNNYSSVQQRAIASAFAGVRQQEKFLVLMENYDSALGYMEVAANSAGTASEKYNAYLDSIEAKKEAFYASFQQLSADVMNSDLIKGVFSTGTGIVSFLDDVIERMGLLGTLSAGAAFVPFLKNLGKPKATGYDCAYLLREEAA